MDISKFDFTKFSKEKWYEVIIRIEGHPWYYIDYVKPYPSSTSNPSIAVYYSHEGFEEKETRPLIFSAFSCNSESATSIWREFMIKEFGEEYKKALIDYLQNQIQQINNI